MRGKTIVAAALIALALPVLAAADPIQVAAADGDAIVRPVGEYLWRHTTQGAELGAGDRIRVRQGRVDVAMPQARLAVLDQGELEFNYTLDTNGALQDWDNDLRLFIGTYQLEIAAPSKSMALRAQTLFGELISTSARLDVEETAHGTRVVVREGTVTVRHRYGAAQPVQAVAGMVVEIGEKSIRTQTTSLQRIAMP